MGNGSESIGSFSQRLVLIRLELHDLPFVEIASRQLDLYIHSVKEFRGV